MASNQYANSKNNIAILKELYNGIGETEDEKSMREFVNKCARLNGLPEAPEPQPSLALTDLVWNKNPFLKLILNDNTKTKESNSTED